MNEQRTPPTPTSVEMTFNVFNGVTGQKINSEPLTEEAAHALERQLHESDAAAPLVIRSNRTFLME